MPNINVIPDKGHLATARYCPASQGSATLSFQNPARLHQLTTGGHIQAPPEQLDIIAIFFAFGSMLRQYMPPLRTTMTFLAGLRP